MLILNKKFSFVPFYFLILRSKRFLIGKNFRVKGAFMGKDAVREIPTVANNVATFKQRDGHHINDMVARTYEGKCSREDLIATLKKAGLSEEMTNRKLYEAHKELLPGATSQQNLQSFTQRYGTEEEQASLPHELCASNQVIEGKVCKVVSMQTNVHNVKEWDPYEGHPSPPPGGGFASLSNLFISEAAPPPSSLQRIRPQPQADSPLFWPFLTIGLVAVLSWKVFEYLRFGKAVLVLNEYNAGKITNQQAVFLLQKESSYSLDEICKLLDKSSQPLKE